MLIRRNFLTRTFEPQPSRQTVLHRPEPSRRVRYKRVCFIFFLKWENPNLHDGSANYQLAQTSVCSPHLCEGFLFLALHPLPSPPPSPAGSHTPHLTHTHLTHTHLTHNSSHTGAALCDFAWQAQRFDCLGRLGARLGAVGLRLQLRGRRNTLCIWSYFCVAGAAF